MPDSLTSDSRITVKGQQIAYSASTGTGRPVVLVHGNSSSSHTWRALMEGPVGQDFRCLALDLPGHGRSAPAPRPEDYSLPGYAALLAAFTDAVGAQDAVFAGWSLGGHVVLEAAAELADAAGFVVFGTPPIATAAQLAEAFLPNPAMSVGFSATVDPEDARAYAASFLAPGSERGVDDFVTDILETDGRARTGLADSVGAGRFADEVSAVTRLTRPLAILHGEGEQLVNLDYLRTLTIPTLWRDQIQIVPGAGHAPHVEATETLAELLTDFATHVNTVPDAAG